VLLYVVLPFAVDLAPYRAFSRFYSTTVPFIFATSYLLLTRSYITKSPRLDSTLEEK
jgi:hypothetical protein